MISPDQALRQAQLTSHDYTAAAVADLCDLLGIDRRQPNWRTTLAPFAPVLAAMITAAAMDYDTAVKGGVVEGAGPKMEAAA